MSCRAVLENLQRGAQQRAEQELLSVGLSHLISEQVLNRCAIIVPVTRLPVLSVPLHLPSGTTACKCHLQAHH